MSTITVEISEDELREVTNAYRILRNFLAKIVSPNELYTDEFLTGLEQAHIEVKNKDLVEVENFADFIR
jgi:hypothetical protein